MLIVEMKTRICEFLLILLQPPMKVNVERDCSLVVLMCWIIYLVVFIFLLGIFEGCGDFKVVGVVFFWPFSMT